MVRKRIKQSFNTNESRHIAETLEERRMLSGYSVNALGKLGLNDTGADPQSALVMDADGNLFGTTQYGGQYGNGTVFEIANGSNTITPLASFQDSSNASNGPLVLDADGNLFGTTSRGGDDNDGTIFEIVHGSSAITTIASFTPSTGTIPLGGLVADSSGNLFGTTETGGANGYGSIFELAAGGSAITVLASPGIATGYYPTGTLTIDPNGNLFGTTNSTVFEVPAGSGSINTLVTFPGYNGPTNAVLLDNNGNLFGSTSGGGGSNDGSLFEIVKGSGAITTLASFNGTNGDEPSVPYMDQAGNIFGNTEAGGTGGGGVVYKLAAGSGTITNVATLPSNAQGGGSAVVIDGAGRIFGTTRSGGAAGTGAVYMVPAGTNTVSTLASCGPTNGQSPNQGLTLDSQGNLWGTTTVGGTHGFGVLDEVDHQSGNVVVAASFDGTNGNFPNGNVVIDADGNVYGTTNRGGSKGAGTVFEWVKSTGLIIPLITFDGIKDAHPGGGLVMDSAGNMYGTAQTSPGSGVLFEIASGTQTLTNIASFNGSNCSNPSGPMAMDTHGNLFGTSGGGANNLGAIFELASGSSTITLVASLDSSESNTNAGIAIDSAGDIYGTAQFGGSYQQGSVFEVKHGSGVVTTVASFEFFATGEHPNGMVLLDDLGNLYGTFYFGPSNNGGVFEVPSGTTTLSIIAPFSSVGGIGGPVSIVRNNGGGFTGVAAGNGGYGEFFSVTPAAPTISFRRDLDGVHTDWTIGSNSGWTVITDRFGLDIAGDGGNDVITLDYTNGNPLPRTLTLDGTFTINGLQGDDPLIGTTVDIGTSTVYLTYAPGFSLESKVQQYLTNGYVNGWDGLATATTGAIRSHAGNTLSTYRFPFGVGFADSADGVVVGQPANTIEIRYTHDGDANLDGVVDGTDALILGRNYLTTGTPGWDQGNFNYDSTVDLSDAAYLKANWKQTTPAQSASAVPQATAPVETDLADTVPVQAPINDNPILAVPTDSGDSASASDSIPISPPVNVAPVASPPAPPESVIAPPTPAVPSPNGPEKWAPIESPASPSVSVVATPPDSAAPSPTETSVPRASVVATTPSVSPASKAGSADLAPSVAPSEKAGDGNVPASLQPVEDRFSFVAGPADVDENDHSKSEKHTRKPIKAALLSTSDNKTTSQAKSKSPNVENRNPRQQSV